MTAASSNHLTTLKRKLAFLSWFFLEPAQPLQDRELRRKSVLLSAFLLILIVIFFGVDPIFLLTLPGCMGPCYGYLFLSAFYFATFYFTFPQKEL